AGLLSSFVRCERGRAADFQLAQYALPSAVHNNPGFGAACLYAQAEALQPVIPMRQLLAVWCTNRLDEPLCQVGHSFPPKLLPGGPDRFQVTCQVTDCGK